MYSLRIYFVDPHERTLTITGYPTYLDAEQDATRMCNSPFGVERDGVKVFYPAYAVKKIIAEHEEP